jgi:WD repeat-containing protein 42A
MKYSGHLSERTIKGCNFYGLRSEYVMTGSDDASIYIWDKATGELLNVLKGHDDVVNCVVSHPELPLIASSGIDDYVRFFCFFVKRASMWLVNSDTLRYLHKLTLLLT